MAKSRNAKEIELIESGWGVLAGFNHLLVTLAAKMGLSSGTLYRLGTPEGQETLLAATKAFLAEVAKTVAPVWRTVTSTGQTSKQLISSVQQAGRTVTKWAKDLMSKPQFVVTNDMMYRLVVIRGDEFAADAERTFAAVRAEGLRRGYGIPPAEVALLLAQFSQAQLGHLWLVVMHDPISDSDGFLGGLAVDRGGGGGEGLGAWYANPTDQFGRGDAFVFLAPQGVVV
mgnify:CR=1 FL=1